MKIERRFTTEETGAYGALAFRTTASEIRNPDGSVVFSLEGIEVPEGWSQVASDVLAQKYFRKAGVPAALKRVQEKGVPAFLWRSVAGRGEARRAARGGALRRRDQRAAGLRPAGRRLGLLGLEGRLFLLRGRRARLLRRDALHAGDARWARRTRRSGSTPGCTGPTASTGRGRGTSTSTSGPASWSSRPRPTSIRSRTPASSSRSQDDLVNEGGIMDLWTREARLFKYGSGTGTNFSVAARRERAAGGRRQVVGADELPEDRRPGGGRDQVGRHHAAGGQDGDLRHGSPRHRGLHQLEGGRGAEGGEPRRRLQDPPRAARRDPRRDPRLGRRRGGRLRPEGEPGAEGGDPRGARRRTCPRPTCKRVLQYAAQGAAAIEFRTYDTDWDSEAYLTVSGQNSNNSVRVTDAFLRAVREDADWELTRRTDGKVAKTVKARDALGRRSAMPPGPAPIRACSSTTRSTPGTPAPRTGRSGRRTRARSTCSSTTPPATSRR